jgi:hypothetical protein
MRFEALLLALVLLAEGAGAARADLDARPNFTVTDQRVIARNDLLRAIVDSDPWLARRILDMLAQMRRSVTDGVDPTENPDLAGVARTAEGSVEWLELMKRARLEKEMREKETASGAARTAEGSVELIEMMKKAKATKDAGRAP